MKQRARAASGTGQEAELWQHPGAGIQGLGVYIPPQVVTVDDLAAETGIAAGILRDKFGICQLHRAGPACHVSDMGLAAGREALADAGIVAGDVDLVVYCGSEYKDFVVWSAAAKIAHELGCQRAQAFEVYALCAGTPVALRIVKDMMSAEPEIGTALVIAASKESELVDRTNPRTSFMFNFGDGAAAAVVCRGMASNLILGSASVLDGSLSDEAIRVAGGSRQPRGYAAGTAAMSGYYFDVPNLDGMRARLDAVSNRNFLYVAADALARSGCDRVDFLAAVHMKRSMQEWLEQELQPARSVYLEDYGHMQAADQLVGLYEGRRRGLLEKGNVVLLLGAGVGYTWAATVLLWGSRAEGRIDGA